MRTTFDMEQDAYKLAKAVAQQKGVSMGRIVAEAVRKTYGQPSEISPEIGRSAAGFPIVRIGKPITSEDVAELEDE